MKNTLEILKKKNKLFFESASFFGDKKYIIEGDELRILTSHGWVTYTFNKRFKLTIKRDYECK